MYFPSPVAGRELPLKPKPELSVYVNGGLLEDPSLLSGLPGKSRSESWGWAGSIDSRNDSRNGSRSGSRGASRGESKAVSRGEPSIDLRGISEDEQGFVEDSRALSRKSARSSKMSQKVFALSATALDHILVRKHGATGPVVFRNKRAARDPETVHDIASIEPLKETTRMGFNKEGEHLPLEDWPKVIRERVASALTSGGESVKQLIRDPKLDAKGRPFFVQRPTIVCHLLYFLNFRAFVYVDSGALFRFSVCGTSCSEGQTSSSWCAYHHTRDARRRALGQVSAPHGTN